MKRAKSVMEASGLNDTTVIRMSNAEGTVREKRARMGRREGICGGGTVTGRQLRGSYSIT